MVKYNQCSKIYKEVVLSGVNKKVDKVIIFIMKIRGVVEGLYLQKLKMNVDINNKIYNKYIWGAL